MSFERVAGIAPEPGPISSLTAPLPAEGIPTALRLQILSTEHWSLLASRSLAWNETFARAGMFLTTLTGAIVALALIAQASAFGDTFRLFVLLILPVVLFIGLATYLRIGMSNYHDAQCVIGMNRIRHAYLELAPDLERYFVMSAHDDPHGIGISMGFEPSTRNGIPLVGFVSATPLVVAVLDSVLAGVIAALAAIQVGVASPVAYLVGLAGFLVVFVGLAAYTRRRIARTISGYRPLFPGPER
jgi:hypothetical protein